MTERGALGPKGSYFLLPFVISHDEMFKAERGQNKAPLLLHSFSLVFHLDSVLFLPGE